MTFIDYMYQVTQIGSACTSTTMLDRDKYIRQMMEAFTRHAQPTSTDDWEFK